MVALAEVQAEDDPESADNHTYDKDRECPESGDGYYGKGCDDTAAHEWLVRELLVGE